MEFPDWILHLIGEDFFDEFGYILDHCLNLNGWLPLLESIWQQVVQEVSTIGKGWISKLGLGCDKRGLEGVLVSH